MIKINDSEFKVLVFRPVYTPPFSTCMSGSVLEAGSFRGHVRKQKAPEFFGFRFEQKNSTCVRKRLEDVSQVIFFKLFFFYLHNLEDIFYRIVLMRDHISEQKPDMNVRLLLS